MRYRGPVITLLAIAALATVLFAVNLTTVAQTAARATAPPGSAQPPVPAQESTAQEPADAPEAGPQPDAADPAAPPAVAAPPPAAYAGRSSGNEVTIAIKVRGSEAAAYVCDGKRIESWLQGTLEDGQLSLQGAEGAKVTGAVQDEAVFGTVQVQGKRWPFAAETANSPAGLYQGDGTVNGAPARVGWIVRQDGSQVGVANVGGVRQPAPAIDPSHLGGVQVGGITIVPRPVTGADDVLRPSS
ncbi:MAG TPA: hypothetical protein VFQ77_02450 [Pseudonocardiaceae bacterium]|jgi:hypothetical protein|nr:hypothetical protein [Pseudonocardiaceae bacterium]